MALVLASKSPRRRQLIELITKEYEVAQADVDESLFSAETPEKLALVLGKAKAEAVAHARPGHWVIGCDTVVDLDGQAVGKPKNEQQAREMLQKLSGTKHLVRTGVCVARVQNGVLESECFTSTTAMYFAPVAPEALEEYIKTEEPYDKAGGYGIQGWAARYVYRLEGCYYNAMGLPVAQLFECLQRKGIL